MGRLRLHGTNIILVIFEALGNAEAGKYEHEP
jgi:hypothetical protein